MSVAIGGLKKVGQGAAAGSVTSNPTFATQAALTLFVDPTGNDGNAGTSSGAGALLTLQAAVNAIPKLVRHPVTVNVATGSYAGLYVEGFVFDPASVAAGAYINFVGGLIAATLASGTATGTATAGSSGSGVTYGTMTDGAQAWTVDDLKGKILEITAGTGVGQTRVIASNTATVITAVGAWSIAPDATSVYAVESWGPVVSTAINQPAIPSQASGTPIVLRIESNGLIREIAGATGTTSQASAGITFKRIKFAPGTAGQGSVRISGPGGTAFTECSINGNTTGIALTVVQLSSVFVDRSYVTSGTGLAVGTSAGATALAGQGASFAFTFSLAETSATSAVANIGTSGNWNSVQLNALVSGAAAIVTAQFSAFFQSQWAAIKMVGVGGGSTIGLNALGVDSAANVTLQITSYSILNCDTGIHARGGAKVSLFAAGTITGTGAQTVGIFAEKGGFVLITTDAVISGYTSDLSVDGATFAYASMTGATPTSIMSPNYGSWIGK